MRSGFESRRCNRDIGQRSNDERLACCPASGLGLYAANPESQTKFERIGDFVDVLRCFGEAMDDARSEHNVIRIEVCRDALRRSESASNDWSDKRTTRRRSFASGSVWGFSPPGRHPNGKRLDVLREQSSRSIDLWRTARYDR